ncbi:MAG TPA: hypothetical protein VE196_02475 [Pseudonocardiaceae bacterium]|nr:hypothetical protein [Pseudonocardiaceae bacterium]
MRIRTLELLDRRGMAQALISRGHPILRVVRHAPGRKFGEGGRSQPQRVEQLHPTRPGYATGARTLWNELAWSPSTRGLTKCNEKPYASSLVTIYGWGTKTWRQVGPPSVEVQGRRG